MLTTPEEVAAVSVLLKNEYPGKEIWNLKKRFGSFHKAFLRELKGEKDLGKTFELHLYQQKNINSFSSAPFYVHSIFCTVYEQIHYHSCIAYSRWRLQYPFCMTHICCT